MERVATTRFLCRGLFSHLCGNVRRRHTFIAYEPQAESFLSQWAFTVSWPHSGGEELDLTFEVPAELHRNKSPRRKKRVVATRFASWREPGFFHSHGLTGAA
jgi:hypothetical protein